MKIHHVNIILLFCVARVAWPGGITAGTIRHLPLQDQALAAAIKQELANVDDMELHFPNSVKRYYKKNRFKTSWVNSAGVIGQTWDAMLLFDCVVQYGLLHSDYHPKQLVYERLDRFIEQSPPANIKEKARFDIVLTDALLTFMNHLHYGRLNPHYPEKTIDQGKAGTFDAVAALTLALGRDDFMATITGVQPTSAEYVALQENLKLVAGQYVGDCYEVPEGDVRKMAINMERLRWINSDDNLYIRINIPSYTLTFHRLQNDFLFRIVVGKPTTPTPVIKGNLRYFYTAPEWKVPDGLFIEQILPAALADSAFLQDNRFVIYGHEGNRLEPDRRLLKRISRNPDLYYARQSTGMDNSLGSMVFRFGNPAGLYLYDTPDQQSFQQTEKALTDGNIRVEWATKLAALLLEADGASSEIPSLQTSVALYERRTFILKSPVPVYVTYLTCEIKNGLLEIYEDPYGLDAALEAAFYD